MRMDELRIYSHRLFKDLKDTEAYKGLQKTFVYKYQCECKQKRMIENL